MIKYIVCPSCNRSVELEDGGVDRKVYACQFCGARIRYRRKDKLAAEARASSEALELGATAEARDVGETCAGTPSDEADFRLRWPAEYRCEDGHYVRSKNEVIVDNWLYSHGVCHAYEKAVFDSGTGETLCSDFFVPAQDLYIEIWGMTSQEYESRRERKIELYRRLGCRLLEIDGDDVRNIDDVLTRELAHQTRELE